MDKLNKILVPIDGSEKSFEALDRALTLAAFTHGEVTCLHVLPHVMKGGPRIKAIDEQIISEGNNILKKASKHIGNKNVRFKTKIIRGSPSYEIIKLSKSGKFDHIVMSTTGSGSATDEMLGSVSNYVLHKSKIPLYLIK
jgi:nucleotide-binding universal stress UspA family protein